MNAKRREKIIAEMQLRNLEILEDSISEINELLGASNISYEEALNQFLQTHINENPDNSGTDMILQLGARYTPIVDLAKPIADMCLEQLDKAVMAEMLANLIKRRPAPFLSNLTDLVNDGNTKRFLMGKDITSLALINPTLP